MRGIIEPFEKERFVSFLPLKKPFVLGLLFHVERSCKDPCLLYVYFFSFIPSVQVLPWCHVSSNLLAKAEICIRI